MKTVLTVGLMLMSKLLFADLPPLIPREVLLGNPDKASPRISPDGKRLAYLAPVDGVLNVWVRTLGEEDDRAVTADAKRGIRVFTGSRTASTYCICRIRTGTRTGTGIRLISRRETRGI
jgi:hypothetical protein